MARHTTSCQIGKPPPLIIILNSNLNDKVTIWKPSYRYLKAYPYSNSCFQFSVIYFQLLNAYCVPVSVVCAVINTEVMPGCLWGTSELFSIHLLGLRYTHTTATSNSYGPKNERKLIAKCDAITCQASDVWGLYKRKCSVCILAKNDGCIHKSLYVKQ